MLQVLQALIAYLISTIIPIVCALGLHYTLISLQRYKIIGVKICNSCQHNHHSDVSCNACEIPSAGDCSRCKHPHSAHIGISYPTTTHSKIINCDCGGKVSEYKTSMFGYKRELINPNDYIADSDGVITVGGRPLYVHVNEYLTTEQVITGEQEVLYTATLNVPTGQKKTIKTRKQVEVETTTMQHKRKPVTTTEHTTQFGMISPSHLTRYIPNQASGYGQGWRYKHSPAQYGQIPTTRTTTKYIDEYIPIVNKSLQWQDVEETIDVTEPQQQTLTKLVPVYETRQVKKREYSFTCACKACLCPSCVYTACDCANCSCSTCKTNEYLPKLIIMWIVVTTSVFIGVIPIIMGVESTRDMWPGLTIIPPSINLGFVFVILGVSIWLSLIISAIWMISEYRAVWVHSLGNGTTRILTVACLMTVVLTLQLTTVISTAILPLVAMFNDTPINIIKCYVVCICMIVVYIIMWIVCICLRNRIRAWIQPVDYIDISSSVSHNSYGSI
nr:hypothetical protein [Faustovirus mariensis]